MTSSKTELEFKNWILTREESGLYWLLINRPKKRNSFSEEVINELKIALNEIENDPKARVLVISSTSDDFFSSGADIDMFLHIYKKDPRDSAEEISIVAQDVFGKIENMPIPVIAAIKGLNLTAGLEMTMCCDIIIAADNAKFGQIETKFGITPGGGGTQRLIRLVGPLKARELIYTARIILADEALRIGLVNHVVPLSELQSFVRHTAEKMLKNSHKAISNSKGLIKKAIYSNIAGFEGENISFGEVFQSGEPQKRLGDFMKDKKKK